MKSRLRKLINLKSRKLLFEALEHRRLLAVTGNVVGDVLELTGDAQPDYIRITPFDDGTGPAIRVETDQGTTINGQTEEVFSGVSAVQLDTGMGSDSVVIAATTNVVPLQSEIDLVGAELLSFEANPARTTEFDVDLLGDGSGVVNAISTGANSSFLVSASADTLDYGFVGGTSQTDSVSVFGPVDRPSDTNISLSDIEALSMDTENGGVGAEFYARPQSDGSTIINLRDPLINAIQVVIDASPDVSSFSLDGGSATTDAFYVDSPTGLTAPLEADYDVIGIEGVIVVPRRTVSTEFDIALESAGGGVFSARDATSGTELLNITTADARNFVPIADDSIGDTATVWLPADRPIGSPNASIFPQGIEELTLDGAGLSDSTFFDVELLGDGDEHHLSSNRADRWRPRCLRADPRRRHKQDRATQWACGYGHGFDRSDDKSCFARNTRNRCRGC